MNLTEAVADIRNELFDAAGGETINRVLDSLERHRDALRALVNGLPDAGQWCTLCQFHDGKHRDDSEYRCEVGLAEAVLAEWEAE